MIVTTTVAELSVALNEARRSDHSIGFVPTMGALHEGHLSLVRESKMRSLFTVVSIFVNPRQFNNPEDLKSYPRMIESDVKLLSEAGCELVFLPNEDEIYPVGFNSHIELELGNLNQVMEAQFRPGHFEGVVSVVYRLFELIHPDFAFFGEKDYQQLLVVKALARKYFPQITIVPIPTVRQFDGLALSSRNRRLTKEAAQEAAEIFVALNKVRDHMLATGKRWSQRAVYSIFEKHLKSRTHRLRIEYFLIADQRDLSTATSDTPTDELRAFTAVYIDNIRLIDNMKIF